MRRNHVVIKMAAKNEVDEEFAKEYGEEFTLTQQRAAIEGMLEEYSAYEDFDVDLSVTFEEEDE